MKDALFNKHRTKLYRMNSLMLLSFALYKITVKEIKDIEVPAITICSYNRIKCSSLVSVMMECSRSPNCTEAKMGTFCDVGMHSGCIISWNFNQNQGANETTSANLGSMCPEHSERINDALLKNGACFLCLFS